MSARKTPRLRDEKTAVLRRMRRWLLVEVAHCAPSMRGAFLAFAVLVDDELRFRDPRRGVDPELRAALAHREPRS